MTDKEIQTNHVKILAGDLDIDAYLAAPTVDGTYPGIVVLQEVFGVNSHIRDVTERIAKLGYVAIAPALFQRLAPGFETGYTPEELEVGRKYAWEQTKASELLSDIQAAIAYLKALPQVKPNAIGCIGFCFGGHVAYLAATLPDIKATAAFYGAGIPTRTPGGGSPTLSRTSEISGTIYAFFGLEDGSIPTEHINQIEAELTKYHISHKIFRYHGAGHGFFCDRRASYNPEATANAWEQVKHLFETL
ncbi:MAG: Carboxymethylenebutenolidase [Chroococcidiopsis cubana SAG 39.79]|jgi:carboxymethylenebutenolidase|uniref:Carboxymethylenebutenolidase n=1 Tax=Chroococcidiopsis cubana SAG 39.79 TaxID=388085 RepID=A0AB37UFI1_9CYAN|nr:MULTISPECIES: dienelactone hydrolase family protein [Chroococcidiopsis]MDZ4874686.1 Carboxymethylenebutenolidase [Chroococcidiopsis cubana SAG 39.79]PSB62480.1 carboxymethylenebutenolidase [Chroococcidiopsis cubana CCALA 043]RUT08724.1 carboxymethylenebutenolidase [Chroococcidiopsis cubana SAG 39.79]URD52202.1 dienelactone hydrolase family protein [Chroococcidiopsis sp. CCNUC1]